MRGSTAPEYVSVELVNTFRTRMAIIHEGEHLPFRRRVVRIRLTDEQRQELAPDWVGDEGGKAVHEEYGRVWLERERKAAKA